MIKSYFKGMNRWKTIVLLGMVLGLFWSCGGAKSAESIALKNLQFEALKTLVATKSFVFNAETAYPMQTYAVMQVTNALLRNTGNAPGRISLTGNGDYITIKGDTVQAELAYFGEVRIVSSMNSRDSGINFDGVPSTFDITENEKKQTLRLEFDIRAKTEPFSVIMQLYPNKRATVFINSINRTSIRYDGKLIELEETEPTSK
jgi:hypothetical protein